MARTQFERSESVAASRKLYLSDRRVFHFSAEHIIDVCPSQRKDGFWVTIATQTLKPKDDLIFADDLLDFITGYGLSVDGLNRIDISTAPSPKSPFDKKGRWNNLVYFIQGEDGGPIKIGYTTDLGERLLSLQASSPVMLRTISCFPATMDDERELHKAFEYCRSHFEWFHPDDSLQLFSKSFRLLYPHFADTTVKKIGRNDTQLPRA